VADLRVLSLGAGVQSMTMALMAAHGLMGHVDAAIFADTGAEPAPVYQHLRWLDRHGYPRPPKSACAECPFTDQRGMAMASGQRPCWLRGGMCFR